MFITVKLHHSPSQSFQPIDILKLWPKSNVMSFSFEVSEYSRARNRIKYFKYTFNTFRTV